MTGILSPLQFVLQFVILENNLPVTSSLYIHSELWWHLGHSAVISWLSFLRVRLLPFLVWCLGCYYLLSVAFICIKPALCFSFIWPNKTHISVAHLYLDSFKYTPAWCSHQLQSFQEELYTSVFISFLCACVVPVVVIASTDMSVWREDVWDKIFFFCSDN